MLNILHKRMMKCSHHPTKNEGQSESEAPRITFSQVKKKNHSAHYLMSTFDMKWYA